jgi:hypothetical protein
VENNPLKYHDPSGNTPTIEDRSGGGDIQGGRPAVSGNVIGGGGSSGVTSSAGKVKKTNVTGKNPPNPYGKKGGPAHQAKIDEIEKALQKRGFDVVREEVFQTPGGFKSKRYADLVAKDKKTGEIKEIHQVGKQNNNGTAVSREKNAIKDIKGSTKYKATNNASINYHPYN